MTPLLVPMMLGSIYRGYFLDTGHTRRYCGMLGASHLLSLLLFCFRSRFRCDDLQATCPLCLGWHLPSCCSYDRSAPIETVEIAHLVSYFPQKRIERSQQGPEMWLWRQRRWLCGADGGSSAAGPWWSSCRMQNDWRSSPCVGDAKAWSQLSRKHNIGTLTLQTPPINQSTTES